MITKDELDVLCYSASNHLIDFCILTNKKYDPNWHHREIAKALEKVERGEIKRLAIFMPPRHGKSELATINFPAWYLGRNPDKEVITVSYSGELASKFGAKTRDKVNDEMYQRIFRDVKLKQDTKSKDFWQVEQGGSYDSVGLGGAITGKGANLLIIDDPIKNKEESQSDVYRDKAWDYYTSTLYTRLEPNAAIVLILTRWHYDDLAGRVLGADSEFKDEWTVIDFPAIAEKDEAFRKKGEPLWESRYTLDDLMRIKATVGLMDWSSLYQQHPLINELQEFKSEYFRYFEESQLENQIMNIDIFIDPALGERDKKQNCEVGFISRAKINDKPEWYLLDDFSGYLTPDQMIELLFKLYIDYKITYPLANVNVWIEYEALQKSLKYWIEEEQRRRQVYFNVNEAKKTQGDKDQRIRGLIPIYRMGLIKHRPYMKGAELEKQALEFPMGKLKDRLDALSFGIMEDVTNPTYYKRVEPKEENKVSDPYDLIIKY
jgi:hypothetical protein